MSTLFRIGLGNHFVRPGDVVWTTRYHWAGEGCPIREEPVAGKVLQDGSVKLIGEDRLVPLSECRICIEEIIL